MIFYFLYWSLARNEIMPISHGEHLFNLIQSLTKAEKRNFRLYAKRIPGEDTKFLQVFDLLEGAKTYSEAALLRKLGDTDKSRFSNLKRSLYQHILTSLRLMRIRKRGDAQVREWLDYADILYGKGLYLQSLKILAKARNLAAIINNDLLHQETLEFEKKIESRHITRSSTSRMKMLTTESAQRAQVNSQIIRLSNLKLALQRHFINHGHARSPEEIRKVEATYSSHLPRKISDLTFFERVFLHQVYFWYHYLLQDFKACLKDAQDWTTLYHLQPHMLESGINMYMKGMHHLLTIAYLLEETALLSDTLAKLEHYRNSLYSKFNYNSQIQSFLFVHYARYKVAYLEPSFEKGLENISSTIRRIRKYENRLDPHKVLILYYKIAGIYFGLGRMDNAIEYLNKVINVPGKPLRQDLHDYAQLLLLLSHYDLGNFDLIEYRVENLERRLPKHQDYNELQGLILQFLRQGSKASPEKQDQIIKRFREQLIDLKAKGTERRAFAFLNPLLWPKLIHKG